jgi:hypothetical protein
MFNPDAFTRAIARSKEKRDKQAVQTSHLIQTASKPSNVVNTTDKLVLSADEQHEQYRITIINSAIAHIKTNKPRGK